MGWVKALLHSIYDQPDAVHAQFDRVIDEHLETARADVLASTAFPKEIWRQIWSNNMTNGSKDAATSASTS